MTPITAWAIKAPDGSGYLAIAFDRYDAINSNCKSAAQWQHLMDEGWRCVRVQITEVQE
jgi:hypothetical protein